VHGQHRLDQRIGVERGDQLNLDGPGQRHGPADADRQAERVGAAQHRVAGHPQPLAGLGRGQALLPVQGAQLTGGRGRTVLAVPPAPGSRLDAVAAQPVPDRSLRHPEGRGDLRRGEPGVHVELAQPPGQVGRVTGAAQRAGAAGAAGPQRHAVPAQRPRHPLPVESGDRRDLVGRLLQAQVAVRQP
jgi:hypothetical protein